MTKRKRILLLSYRYAETGAIMVRHRSLVTYMCERGVAVDIVGKTKLTVPLQDGITYTQVSRFRDISIRKLFLLFLLFFKNIYLIRKETFRYYFQLVAEAAYALERIHCLFKKNNYDACLIGILPWEFYFIVPYIKKKCQTVLDISDPLYKNAFFDKENHPLNKRVEGKALRRADKIIVMNEMTIDMYVEEMGVDRNKLIYLPPATDIGWYQRNRHYDFCLEEPIKIIYSGTLYPGYRDLYEVEKALASVHGFILDVVTRPGYKDTEWIHYHEWMPHEKIVTVYQEYDILLFVDNFFGYQVPSKIFELIATNKPILFVYDRRNMYLYNLLKDQKGIFFVENKCEKIKGCLEDLIKRKQIEVNYTIDLKPYSQEYINEEITKQLLFN